ncbi:unnamed protein product [Colias eurytheme]|nr:unnamed protein product [Colias eurytheme]
MLEKWKKILTNWINCYFNEGDKKELPVSLETLIDIISHLRDNFNLDESKSSLLEAHTVHEFILEKYPDFKFENGTAKPESETELHIAASLLLYFVCVNSKDVDIKNAMCKNLGVDDQEIILKFSKCLMACSRITCEEVLAAIKDACGQDVVRTSLEPFTVSETPPALRSLHNEVRRLQAALEAERFDRNYLQDELSRTNLKLEKLVKDKEQYKLEVLNLKAKISLCCGEDKEAKASEPAANNSSKLLKQLEEAEERLVNVQEQLDDAQHERDVFKSKLEESKRDYDKLLALSQQETSRANQLAEELETERHHTQSLRELVSELRQHNRLNGLDTSQYECDDLDASIHSPQQNLSICSEACANVIEVQLSEERAKIVVLKGHIQELQDQLNNLNKKYEDEKQTFINTTAVKEKEIISLKHRINEETEEKNNIKIQLHDELDRFKSEINELERKLKDTNENSQRVIETKMQEIQTLQEEKMSLLQSLSNETTKLENVIRNLQIDIENEKASKSKMREDYDNHIMKLNEKVLNRSNELCELQNKIEDNGERIDQLQIQLKKEKDLKDDMSNKHNNDIVNLNAIKTAIENELKRKSEELLDVQMELKQQIDINTTLKKELDHMKNCYTKSKEEMKLLEENKERLFNDIKGRDKKIEILQKDLENLKNESQATIFTLKSQLQDEIQYKLGLQKNISTFEKAISDKDKTIVEIEKELAATKEQAEKDIKTMNDDILEKKKLHECQLEIITKEKDALQENLKVISTEKNNLIENLKEKSSKINLLEEEVKQLSGIVDENNKAIQTLQDALQNKTIQYDELQKDFNSETSKLAAKLNEMEKSLKEVKSKSHSCAENDALTIQTLNMERENLNKTLQAAQEKITMIENEKVLLINQLEEEISQKTVFEKEYLKKCATLNDISTQLNDEIVKSKAEVSSLNEKVNELEKEKTQMNTEINLLELNLSQTIHKYKDVILNKDSDIQVLTSKLSDLESMKTELENKLKNEKEIQMQAIEVLQRENIQLQYTLEEDNINHEESMKEKNNLLEKLEGDLCNLKQQMDIIKHNYDEDKIKWENLEQVKNEEITSQEKLINDLKTKLNTVNEDITEKQKLIANLTAQNTTYIDSIAVLNKEIGELRKDCATNAQGHATEKAVRDTLESEKKNLVEENRILLQKTLDDQTAYQVLEAERNSLLNEKAILVQELLEEKGMRKLVDEEKEQVVLENKNMIEHLNETKHALIQEKECLTQQLVDEGLAKKVLEQEKCDIANIKAELDEKLATEILNRMQLEKQINKLITENSNLSEEISQLKTMVNALEKEKGELYQQVESFIVEKEDSHSQLEIIKEKVNRLTHINNELIGNKSEMAQEEKVLTKSVNELKITLSEVKSERDSLAYKLQELNKQHHTEMCNTQEEMKNITTEFNHLKSDYKNLQETYNEIGFVLNDALENIINMIETKKIDHVLGNRVFVKNNSLSMENINYVLDIATTLIEEVISLRNTEVSLKEESTTLKIVEEEKDKQISTLTAEIQNLLKTINENETKMLKQNESHNAVLESKTHEILKLQNENQSLHNELNTVRVQLDERVHSLKDKLIDNEIITDKLKETYECQIDNLNMMVTKLTNYLKDKTVELETLRNEKDKLQANIDENNEVINSFEEEIKSHKQIQEKLISEFESERLVLKNMVTVTESVMEDQKDSLNKVINVHLKTIDTLQEEIAALKQLVEVEKTNTQSKINEKESTSEALCKAYNDVKKDKEALETKYESELKQLIIEKNNLSDDLERCKKDVVCKDEENNELKIKLDSVEKESRKLKEELIQRDDKIVELERLMQEKEEQLNEVLNQVADLKQQQSALEKEKEELLRKINELTKNLESNMAVEDKLHQLVQENEHLKNGLQEKQHEINGLESRLQTILTENKQLQEAFDTEKINIINKCALLQEYQEKAEQELLSRQKEIESLKETIENVAYKYNEEKDALSKQLEDEKIAKKRYLEQIKELNIDVCELRRRLDDTKHDMEVVNVLRKENEELYKLVGQRETFAVTSQEKSNQKYSEQVEKELRQLHNQVDSNSTDTHSSMESYQTIADLEKIVQDKNRTITTLQSDITYLKSLIAESENKLLDVSKDLEMSKENCYQLSSQLKKIVHQKNEEISELKKQVSKMSATESRATQIIKLSAKYQAMILKRVAELKSNTILKELTNFGNSNNCDNELRRNLNAGTITMEDLENFLETTDRHLKGCTEKQIALQKERDRLSEVSRINESEVINMRKFLTELSVCVKTFNSVKDLYSQKLSRVISLQRTVRREILNLDGHITDATMCKLERGYAAVMQDLSECAMNMERWVERSIGRTISAEKIKQAFTSELDRVSLKSTSFQNTSLEVQLEEMENSFQRLLEEVSRAQKGEGARDAQAVTVMEVRAEYEDKLNRMKAKMKQLYQEQISIFKEKQKEEVASLERELEETRNKLEESSRAYEKHIRSLTTELWNVGEKFLMKKDEAEWLRKTQRSGSLMSLQHVHSSGLIAPQEEPSRPSDSHSLRSLPVNTNNNKVHMSDEEGEVFDNRWLRELASTPRREKGRESIREGRESMREGREGGQRLSELRWRNSLCPPHLKSSYPAETQFTQTLHEEDIKCVGSMSMGGRVRKEVGITAYKKPGPPTPSKQAGRLSATDSELRESLRVEAEPGVSRKTSTPSRLRALFRGNKNDTTEGTPRTRRLSNIFRKK